VIITARNREYRRKGAVAVAALPPAAAVVRRKASEFVLVRRVEEGPVQPHGDLWMLCSSICRTLSSRSKSIEVAESISVQHRGGPVGREKNWFKFKYFAELAAGSLADQNQLKSRNRYQSCSNDSVGEGPSAVR